MGTDLGLETGAGAVTAFIPMTVRVGDADVETIPSAGGGAPLILIMGIPLTASVDWMPTIVRLETLSEGGIDARTADGESGSVVLKAFPQAEQNLSPSRFSVPHI